MHLTEAVRIGDQVDGASRPGFMTVMALEDATRRTRLANERTYLAWWRSGLTALAVGLAAGKLVPEQPARPVTVAAAP